RHTRLQGDWSSDVCSSDLKCSIIEERAEFSGGIVVAVVGREIHDYFNAVGMGGCNQVVKGSKAVVGGPKVFFNSFEVAGRVAVIGGGGLTLAVWNIEVEIIHRGRDPDGGGAQPLDIRHFLLDARQITAP